MHSIGTSLRHGHFKAVRFRFRQQQILGSEHMLSGETRLAPEAVLIDDLPPDDRIAIIKRWVLGIEVSRYFQVPAFDASTFEAEGDLITLFGEFLRQYRPRA